MLYKIAPHACLSFKMNRTATHQEAKLSRKKQLDELFTWKIPCYRGGMKITPRDFWCDANTFHLASLSKSLSLLLNVNISVMAFEQRKMGNWLQSVLKECSKFYSICFISKRVWVKRCYHTACIGCLSRILIFDETINFFNKVLI